MARLAAVASVPKGSLVASWNRSAKVLGFVIVEYGVVKDSRKPEGPGGSPGVLCKLTPSVVDWE